MPFPTLDTIIADIDTLAATARLVKAGPPDTEEPQTILVSGPPPVTNTDMVSIEFSGTDDRPGPFTFDASIDGAPYAKAVSPLVVPNAAGQDHAVLISCIDAAGNRDSSPLQVRWTRPLIVVPPTPPAATTKTVPLLITDTATPQNAPGALTRDNLYYGAYPFANRNGDWFGADGVAQSAKSFAAPLVLAKNAVGPFTLTLLNPSQLIVKDEQPQLVLRVVAVGGTGPQVYFGTRETGTGAKLLVTYLDGSTATLPVIADACTENSTVYRVDTMLLNTAQKGYFRFAAPTQDVTKAQLVIAGSAMEAASVHVYKFAVHRKPVVLNPVTLKGDPRTFFYSEAFNEPTIPRYLHVKLFGDDPNTQMDTWKQRAVVDIGNGEQAFQVTFDPHVGSALSASICFPNFDEADEAAWQFKIRPMPDMLTGLRDGIKLALGASSATEPDDNDFANRFGMIDTRNGKVVIGRVGTLAAGNGGSKSNGRNGWSMRLDAQQSPPPDHPLHGLIIPTTYAYHPEQKDYYGDQLVWNESQTALRAGEWSELYQRLKVNSVGPTWVALVQVKDLAGNLRIVPDPAEIPLADQSGPTPGPFGMSVQVVTGRMDAEFDGVIDGVVAITKRNFRVRRTLNPDINALGVISRLAIGRIWFNVYHGGTTVPLHRCSFQVRDIYVAKFA